MDEAVGLDRRHPAKYRHALDDGRIQCTQRPRGWYDIRHCDLTAQGSCPQCGTRIAGRFGEFA